MSISELSSYRGLAGDLTCPRCNAPLLPQATFCSSCGERLDKKRAVSALLQDEQDITVRYRLTSLLRRSPGVTLYFALDNQQARQGQQSMVAIRDIDITSLADEARVLAIEVVQQEYDLLRHLHLPYVMPVVDLRYSQGHLYVVAAQTGTTGGGSIGNTQRLYTLQDFLQSGQGLPSEQQALRWIWRLCQALEGLHRHQIVVGELDPYTIILNENSEQAEPTLMISWLPPQLRNLLTLPGTSKTPMSYFSAPEALQGNAEARSDIYSLGAILYLLLTGSPPGESMLRAQRPLRTPRELNSRISSHAHDCVMQALSIEPSGRFQSAGAMAEALKDPHYRFRPPRTTKRLQRDNESGTADAPATSEGDAETVRIVALSQKHLVSWQASRSQTTTEDQVPQQSAAPQQEQQPAEIEPVEAEQQQQSSPPFASTPPVEARSEAEFFVPADQAEEKESEWGSQAPSQGEIASPSPQIPRSTPAPTWRERVPGIFTAITSGLLNKSRSKQTALVSPRDSASQNAATDSWFKQLQRILLGQQQHTIMAAALVESPLRVQPNQAFTLRLHLMGRDEPALPPGAKKGDHPAGLSGLVHGETTLLEVRSVLHQSYTYIVQQATVTIPAAGYAAEVLIPMQPLSNAPGGRRDRLYIFFLDEQRTPLYEKPFVVEVFVSQLVKPGQEGHQVLAIPV